MEMLKAVAACLCGTGPEDPRPEAGEKASLLRNKADGPRSAHQVSAEVIELLRSAEKNGPALRRRVSDAVGAEGWTEKIARAIVAGLESLIKEDRTKIGSCLADAIDRADEAARAVFAFEHEHPYLVAGFVTIVAVGVLALMAPWVVEALGFAELGPVADSFAAWWQSTYLGSVPKGSLFSFFQRLGMVWGSS